MNSCLIKIFSFSMTLLGLQPKASKPSEIGNLVSEIEKLATAGGIQFVNANIDIMTLARQDGWSPKGERRWNPGKQT